METDGQWDPRKCGRAMVSQQRANKLFFRQVTRNQKREWRDLPWAQWQYRDGLRSMGQLSTGQRPQFKIALTHLLIILILSFPEARGAYQGCPSDISAWSPLHQDLPRAAVPRHHVQPGHFTLSSFHPPHFVISGARPATPPKKLGSSSRAGFTQRRQWQAPHKHTGGQKELKSKEDLRSLPATGVLLTGLLVKKLCEEQKLLPFFQNLDPKKQWSC